MMHGKAMLWLAAALLTATVALGCGEGGTEVEIPVENQPNEEMKSLRDQVMQERMEKAGSGMRPPMVEQGAAEEGAQE